MSFLKGLKGGGDRSAMIRLAGKAMDDPGTVLKRIDRIVRGIGSEDYVVRTLSAYILYRMAREDLNEEVRHYVGDMSGYLMTIDNSDSFEPAKIKCPTCMNVNEINPPVFPNKMSCTGCGKIGKVMIPPPHPAGWRLSELYWTVSFLFQMARKGHLDGMEPAKGYMESLKDHPSANIRKRSRMTVIMISEDSRKSG